MSVQQNFNPLPAAGDIVWCKFPHKLGTPGPKSRPALVMSVSPTTHEVEVAYGTTQKTFPPNIYPTEFVLDPLDQGFHASGLSYRTKFDFKNRAKLPFNDEWFEAAPGSVGSLPLPKLGVLHACYYKAARAAYTALMLL